MASVTGMRVGLGWCWLVLAGLGLVTSQQTDHTNIQNLDLSPAGPQLSASVDTLACGDMVDFSSRYLGDLYLKIFHNTIQSIVI